MLQAFLIKPGRIELRESSMSEPSEGEVLIMVKTALTCGTDLKAYMRGHKLIPMPGPFGHEYSGIVLKTGKGVRRFREGDEVMGVHSAPCLECRYCKRRLFNLCERIMQTKVLGAFSEYLLIPRNVVRQNLFHKPESLSFQEAALLEPLSCVVHPYNKWIKDGDTKTALIIGTGAIGIMHLAYLKMKGTRTFATDISEQRLSLASRIGAETTRPDEVMDLIMQRTDGMGVDLVVECTGKEEVWQKSIDYLRKGGTVILFGGCPQGSRVSYSTHRLHYDEMRLLGSFHYTPQDVRYTYKLLTDKRLDLSFIISGEFGLRDIGEVFRLLKSGEGIKYVIRP